MRTIVSVSAFSLLLISSKPFDPKEGLSRSDQLGLLTKQIVRLHELKGPVKVNVVWNECGKRVKGERARARALEYGEAIMKSVEDVYVRTGTWVDPRHPAAILYRESSFDECIIGKRETTRLSEQLGRVPNKQERIRHLRRWMSARKAAKRWCRAKKVSGECMQPCLRDRHHKSWCRKLCKVTEAYSNCVRGRLALKNPEYRGIHGWDLGAAQFRWPGWGYRDRMVILPDGKQVEDLQLESFFDHRVSVQMLVENLARFKELCKDHEHYQRHRRTGRRRLVPPEEAYLAHHHTGPGNWSEKYWRAVGKHLKVMNSVQPEHAIAKNDQPGDPSDSRFF